MSCVTQPATNATVTSEFFLLVFGGEAPWLAGAHPSRPSAHRLWRRGLRAPTVGGGATRDFYGEVAPSVRLEVRTEGGVSHWRPYSEQRSRHVKVIRPAGWRGWRGWMPAPRLVQDRTSWGGENRSAVRTAGRKSTALL